MRVSIERNGSRLGENELNQVLFAMDLVVELCGVTGSYYRM